MKHNTWVKGKLSNPCIMYTQISLNISITCCVHMLNATVSHWLSKYRHCTLGALLRKWNYVLVGRKWCIFFSSLGVFTSSLKVVNSTIYLFTLFPSMIYNRLLNRLKLDVNLFPSIGQNLQYFTWCEGHIGVQVEKVEVEISLISSVGETAVKSRKNIWIVIYLTLSRTLKG